MEPSPETKAAFQLASKWKFFQNDVNVVGEGHKESRTPTFASEVDLNMVKFAKEFLNSSHYDDDNVQKMISGVKYFAMGNDLISLRAISTELCHQHHDISLEKDCLNDVNKFVEKRLRIIQQIFGKCDNKTYVESPFNVDYGLNTYIGKNFYANFNMTLLDVSLVLIGDNVKFGPNVQLTTAGHPVDALQRISGDEFGRPIVIGNNVWVGMGATILPGVWIGDNSVVAAGAVVTKSFPANSVIGGVPAKIIRRLGPNGVDNKFD